MLGCKGKAVRTKSWPVLLQRAVHTELKTGMWGVAWQPGIQRHP